MFRSFIASSLVEHEMAAFLSETMHSTKLHNFMMKYTASEHIETYGGYEFMVMLIRSAGFDAGDIDDGLDG